MIQIVHILVSWKDEKISALPTRNFVGDLQILVLDPLI